MMVQRREQRIQMLFVAPPPPYGALIQRLPNLPVTYGRDRTLPCDGSPCRPVPPQAKKFESTPALTFEVAGRVPRNSPRSFGWAGQGHPVSSQASNKPRPVPAIREVIRKMLSFGRETFGSSTITRCRDYRDCNQMIRARGNSRAIRPTRRMLSGILSTTRSAPFAWPYSLTICSFASLPRGLTKQFW